MTAQLPTLLAQADAHGIDYTVTAYLAYFLSSVFITIWVGRSLHTNGRLFLVDAFHGNTGLADSVNHLLLVGFYLINIGAMLLFLATGETLTGTRGVIELLSRKMGWVLLVLGFMHMLNLRVLSRMRRHALEGLEPLPIAPTVPAAAQTR